MSAAAAIACGGAGAESQVSREGKDFEGFKFKRCIAEERKEKLKAKCQRGK